MTNDGPKLWVAMVLTAMAGGLGWGIRGQYGHETGAMIAGVLVALVLTLLFCPAMRSLRVARAVALTTVAISFGGSMTYGQTVGLTHDGPLIGNTGALAWGLFGLFVKGGIWIGFAGVFLGLSLSDQRYRPLEIALMLGVAILLLFVGRQVLNEPFNPDARELPTIYFSDHWRWEPEGELKPRHECWGGLLFALVGMMVYTGWCRRDVLARRMGWWGMLGGGLGFSLGQCVQAFHAWNAVAVDEALGWLGSHINWWNMMETTFGLVFGAMLALGLWRNRHLIALQDDGDEVVEISSDAEWFLIFVQVAVVAAWTFWSFRAFDRLADMAIPIGLLPMVAVLAGRLWPYALSFFLVSLPIIGKTYKELLERDWHDFAIEPTLWYFALPLAITAGLSTYLAKRSNSMTGRSFAAIGLLGAVWLYMGLNWVFFDTPWPWDRWTGRTPNGLIFSVCALGLSIGALVYGRPKSNAQAAAEP